MENSVKGKLLGVVGEVRDEALVKIGAKPSLAEQILDALFDNPVTITFSLVVLAVFIFALVQYFRPNEEGTNAFVSAAPGLLTTIGILGTFLGIFVGLLEFDVYEIDQSVPKLLSGLKIAFLTSILGITAALVLRVIFAAVPKNAQVNDVTPEDIHQILSESLNIHRDTYHSIRTAGTQMTNPRYVTQIDGVRQALEEQQQSATASTEAGFANLIDEFRQFSAKLSAILEQLERADIPVADLERNRDSLEGDGDGDEPAIKN